MKLSQSERQERFAHLTPENKSALKRTHAERWLAAHEQQLTVGQIAAIQEGIRFLSPATYRNAGDPKLRQEEAQLKTKLECSLGRQWVTQAFTFLESNTEPGWTERIDEWLSWFRDCLVK